MYEREHNNLFCGTHKPWFPKLDVVHYLYMAFEILQVFENKPQRLTRWLTTLYLALWIFSFQVAAFNMIYHLRRAAKRTHRFFVAPRFVSNTEQALRLTAGARGPTSGDSSLKIARGSWATRSR